MDLAFNLFFSPLSLLIVWLLSRTKLTLVLAIPIWAIAGFAIAYLTAEDGFHLMRNCCWLIFIQLPIISLIYAYLVRKKKPLLSKLFIALTVVITLIGIDAFFIEPNQLVITTHIISSAEVTEALVIAVLSDIQTDHIGKHEQKAIQQAVMQNPDLILFPGDYIQMYKGQDRTIQENKFNALLKSELINVKYGSFAVQGNTEYTGWASMFSETTVTPIIQTTNIKLDNKLFLTGLSFKDGYSANFKGNDSDGFHIEFAHYPDFSLGNSSADLLIAGHTHGGQVQLPFIGPLITLSQIPRKWASGLNEINSDQFLVVSRGIGMERHFAPRLRFLCKPELVIIKVIPEK